jgi:hypothetical protein
MYVRICILYIMRGQNNIHVMWGCVYYNERINIHVMWGCVYYNERINIHVIWGCVHYNERINPYYLHPWQHYTYKLQHKFKLLKSHKLLMIFYILPCMTTTHLHKTCLMSKLNHRDFVCDSLCKSLTPNTTK